MPHPVTEWIHPTEELVAYAAARLSTSTHWHVRKLPGMNPDSFPAMLPDLKLPCLLVTHEGSEFLNFPRRTAVLSVVVAVDATRSDAEFTARELSDEAISLLDDQRNGHAHYRIRSYRAMKTDPGITAHRLLFEVKDN